MMKFTFAWLKEHLDTDRPLGEIADKLTMIGLEVERIEDKAKLLAPFVIARVVEAKQHPNADRLRVCMVDTGDGEPIQVVCGAPNARTGMNGVFAPPGAFIPGKNITLGVGKIRDVESRGMLVSEAELQISDDHDGIIELPDDAPVGESYAQYAGLDDPVIEINLTPNRADCTGVHGIARDLAAADMGKFKDPAIKPVKGEFPCPVKVTLDFGATPSLCPAFALRLVRGVKNGPSPDWLQKRLIGDRACARSMRWSISPTSSPTTAAGRCMCSMPAKVQRQSHGAPRAAPAKTLLALDGKTYTLDDTICVIADDDGVESLAGIMGGEKTGCSETTTDVLIESALWEPINIAQTGRKLGINSDARYRFERGVDPAFMLPGLELATPHGARSVRRHAVGGRRRRQRRAAGAHHRFPAVRTRAPRRPRRAAHRDAPRARAARLLRRRPGRAGEGRGAVVAARRRRARPTSSRRSCASSASTACRSTPFDRGDGAAQAGADPDPGAHAQGQARARRAQSGRSGDLVVHRQAAGRTVRRRQAGTGARQSDRGRSVRHAAEPHSGPGRRGAEERRSRLSRCRPVRSRPDFSRRPAGGSVHRRGRHAPRAGEAVRHRPALVEARTARSMPSTPRPMRSPC